MAESRVAIRAQFDANRTVNTNDIAHMEGLLTMVDEAEDMLLNGIVRGELNEEKGHYEVKIRKDQAEKMGEKDGTTIEPITAETGEKDSSKPEVTVTSCGGPGRK